jgi:hypothetical protein
MISKKPLYWKIDEGIFKKKGFIISLQKTNISQCIRLSNF